MSLYERIGQYRETFYGGGLKGFTKVTFSVVFFICDNFPCFCWKNVSGGLTIVGLISY